MKKTCLYVPRGDEIIVTTRRGPADRIPRRCVVSKDGRKWVLVCYTSSKSRAFVGPEAPTLWGGWEKGSKDAALRSACAWVKK